MAILRLIRWINLVIIAATMYSIRLFLITYEKIYPNEIKSNLLGNDNESFDFFLLVLSTIMIAAAGNVINDYFDIKADRINKPERVIVGKSIKRRWAIIIHSALNVGAFAIAIYLGVRNNTFWYLFIHLISMNSLWFYSLYLKKQPFVGNFLIAGLTALVPILCGVHFYIQKSIVWDVWAGSDTAFSFWFRSLIENGHFILLLAFFAFVNNFAREIIKDIEDVEGDNLVEAQTIPIRFGIRTAKLWATLFLVLPIVFFSTLFVLHQSNINFSILDQFKVFLPVILSLFFDLFAILYLWNSKSRSSYKIVDRLVKFSMISGILTSVYWYVLWI